MNLFRKLIFVCTILCVVFSSCSNVNDFKSNSEKSGRARIKFSVDTESRSISPSDLTEDEISKVLLEISGTEDNEFSFSKQYNSLSELKKESSVLLDVGTYTFELSIYVGTSLCQTASVTEAVSAGLNSITFNAKYIKDGKGAFCFCLNWSEDTGITGAKAVLLQSDAKTVVQGFEEQNVTVENNSVTWSKLQVPCGTYYIKFTLWDEDGICTKTLFDVIKIFSGRTTTSTNTVSDVNTRYKIEYVLNGAEWKEDYVAPAEFNENMAVILPTEGDFIEKDGLGFSGWYETSNFSDEPINTINFGTNKNVKLYARYGKSINYVSCGAMENSNPISYASYEDFILLKPACRQYYNFDGWYSEPDFENIIEEIDCSSGTEITLYAKWTVIAANMVGAVQNADNEECLYFTGNFTNEDWCTLKSTKSENLLNIDLSSTFGLEEISATSGNSNENIKKIILPSSLSIIGRDAFSSCISLSEIKMPNTIISIEDWAFYYCISLSKIKIPDTVVAIGDNAFKYCSSLSEVEIPNSVTSIGQDAFGRDFLGCPIKKVYISSVESWVNIDFKNADSNPLSNGADLYLNGEIITQLKIPNTITEIKGYAFCSCTSLSKIEIPDSVISIGNDAFSGCTSLSKIEIPDSVISIGDGAFSGCTSLSKIEIPDSVISIGGGTFYGCTSLSKIEIPNSVTSIESNAFCGCTSLSEIEILTSNITIKQYAFDYCVKTIILNVDSVDVNLLLFGCADESRVILTDKVRKISAFTGFNLVKELKIPNSVKLISEDAFRENIRGLIEKVEIDSLDSWCNIVFENEKSNPLYYGGELYINGEKLTQCTIPDSVTLIGQYAFCSYKSLSKLEIPDTVIAIGDNAFRDCSSLPEVEIPNSVTSIGREAFLGCSSLKKVYISSLESWVNIDFKNADSNPLCNGADLYLNGEIITQLKIPNTITEIKGYYAFSGCTSLSAVEVPNSVTNFGWGVFYNCSSLCEIQLNCSIPYIGGEWFCGCSLLSKIEIPDSVTIIGQEAFEDCISLSEIEIPNSVTVIYARAFERCTSLSKIEIPNSVKELWGRIFDGCSSLQEISYNGTKNQWNAITFDTKYGDWNDGSSIQKIICTDGEIAIE